MKKLFFIIIVCLSFSASYGAQKILTVNVEKIFNSYYKTSQVENIIKKQAQVYQNYLNKKLEEIKKIDKDFRIQLDRAQNVTLSQKERNEATTKAQKLSNDIRVIRTEMENYSKEKRNEMASMTMKKREELLNEISDCVRKIAKGLSADFVFDVSGKTTHQIPALIYAAPSTDITNQVIQLLNKGNMPEKRN